ncbi:hypothetical protein BC835DRAFT_1274316 [Cytidiella melzeri]|nr:hypothetical protein BC835DRAFT_1274316 [Cytidiella melzeri]
MLFSYGVTLRNDEYVFTPHNITESPVMPEVTVLSPNASKAEILEHYEVEGKLPRPFAPFMGTPPSPLTPDQKKDNRASTASWISWKRSSFLSAVTPGSGRSSVASFASNASGKDKRTIRQTFNPVLPDELVVSIGERLHVVTSYDDGWCIVGRDSVFKPGEIELGSVPAWCFVKPIKGLRAERPLRTTSLGVSVNLEEPNSPARDNVMSWSNF